jgi:hypothetical protein
MLTEGLRYNLLSIYATHQEQFMENEPGGWYCVVMKNSKKIQKKASWQGKVLCVQPRVLVERKQKALGARLLGYNLLIEGDITLDPDSRVKKTHKGDRFVVAVDLASLPKSGLHTGDVMRGESRQVPAKTSEIANYCDNTLLRVVRKNKKQPKASPPHRGRAMTAAELEKAMVRPLGRLRFRQRCYKCSRGILAKMPETNAGGTPRPAKPLMRQWCAGPTDCALYTSGRHRALSLTTGTVKVVPVLVRPIKATKKTATVRPIKTTQKPAAQPVKITKKLATVQPVKTSKKLATAPLLNRRTTALKNMHTKLVETLNLDNCPDDYTQLKLEAKYLAGLSDYAFVVMAQRLSAIRDQRLYTQDDYDNFRSFIEGELNLSRTTVYRHLDIFEFFGEHLIKEGKKSGAVYTKLALAVPLLRKVKNDEDRAKLLKKFWSISKTKTIKQMQSEVSTIRRIHVDKDVSEQDISKTRKNIEQIKLMLPVKPNKQDIALYLELANYIEKLCFNI